MRSGTDLSQFLRIFLPTFEGGMLDMIVLVPD